MDEEARATGLVSPAVLRYYVAAMGGWLAALEQQEQDASAPRPQLPSAKPTPSPPSVGAATTWLPAKLSPRP